MDTIVELEGVNGEWFTLAGPNAGDRGIHLGTGVKGLYDPPVKVVREEPGNYPGSRYLNHRILQRDIVFGVEILNDFQGENSWLSRDSEWRKAWSYEEDCKLHITTEESGRRTLYIRLAEQPDISLFTDPKKGVINRATMTCVAGDPFWYGKDEIYEARTEKDTRFDPNTLPWPWPVAALPYEDLQIVVDPSDGKGGLNPTDQPIFPKWIAPGSTEDPAEPYFPGIPWLGAPKSPAVIWTIPDYSFEDPDQANKRIRLPGLIGGLVTNEIQLVRVIGVPTGGTFKVQFGEVWTNDISWSGGAGALQNALQELASVGPGNVKVTKGILFSDPYKVEFLGELSGVGIPLLTVQTNFSGTSNPTLAVSRQYAGKQATAENVVIDTDPRVEQVVSESGSQIWARMNGVRWRNLVPPYTKSKTFYISVSGCEAGQVVTLRLPRPWSRPWGLE
ncbi:hypothetical protein [Mycobacteroides chelonae]|uniref:hypothetical protein n=1 Tax=Mycobacteroides chelonae TaxID=1774 RepID=UPI0004A9FC4F|nr:hypothetical protein [Mycobacteroides chelonae]OHT67764.1 phage tail protein [Mycobacteroides chelonae]OHT69407.1 phage tail protein [Mycobacteroides chelonae]